MPSLDELVGHDCEVAAVVTNPDRPAGRGMKLTASPVKEAALAGGIEVMQDRARSPEMAARLKELAPDVAVVVAYGSILPGALLEIPRKGFVNLHFSLLPLYRGAAPVQRSIMNGDEESGVSVMVLTEGMDEGPILATLRTPIRDDDTSGSLGERLAVEGAGLLVRSLESYVAGDLEPIPQDDDRATYAPKISTEEAGIDWSMGARKIRDLVRALDPQPGAWTTLDGDRLKVWGVTPLPGPVLEPGAITVDEGLLVGTGDDALRLDELQPATKTRMSGEAFARGFRPTGTERMGG